MNWDPPRIEKIEWVVKSLFELRKYLDLSITNDKEYNCDKFIKGILLRIRKNIYYLFLNTIWKSI